MYQQSIFSTSLLFEIYDEELTINIDESSFSKSVKSNYSWFSIRQSSIINVYYQRKASLMWALMINGHWVWLMSKDTMTTQDFNKFIHLLRIYLDKTFDWKGIE